MAEVQAAAQLKRAADQGDVRALYELGSMHALGKGVPQDDVRAAALLRLAADQGDSMAQYTLGMMADDDGRAAALFKLAADQGEARAQLILGAMHLKGISVPQDHVRGVALIKLAADQGDAKKKLIRFKRKSPSPPHSGTAALLLGAEKEHEKQPMIKKGNVPRSKE